MRTAVITFLLIIDLMVMERCSIEARKASSVESRRKGLMVYGVTAIVGIILILIA